MAGACRSYRGRTRSVGYGDVVLGGDWRILASLQGANGVIVFGWATALIFYVIHEVYRRREGVGG